ncbi:MAG TPA: HdeD family acid-resistance protein [Mycobacterium sp.]|uniref:HdeD family acid-resistance protein n=1 Tax=Mycobacterium sp. TaxID=1785 RepID=UPI002C2A1BA9|nr:HdeD family acid-resistance protein [Mycobacterium sp.]HME74659.1 HdeD family acid-resistance protein [Mycobacterium sp.]
MTTIKTPKPLQSIWQSVLLTGITTAVLGGLILGWPDISIVAAATLLGIYLVVSGVAEVIYAFSLLVPVPYRVLLFITGLLSVALGILSLRHFGDQYAVLLLAIWVGVGFVLQGVAETGTAISYRDLPGRGWYIFFGVVSILAGVVVLGWPFDSIAILAYVTGAWLVVIGILEIVAALYTRHHVNTVEKRVSGVFESAPAKTS